MLTFGWTSHNPLERDSASQDPLKSLGLAMRLGELLFPGTSGRIWRIRYLSELCYVISLAGSDADKSYRDNYLTRVRIIENLFLVLRVLRLRSKPDDVGHIVGKTKVDGLMRSNSTLDLRNELMVNQIALGPLGIHLVSLVSMKLVDSDNLTLTVTGEDLAKRYRKALGKSADIIENLAGGLNRGLKTEGLAGDLLIDFCSKDQEKINQDNVLLFDLLNSDPIRKLVIKDLRMLNNDNRALDDQSCLIALKATGSNLATKYDLVYGFDQVMRCLYFSFNNLMMLRTDSVRRKIDDIAFTDLALDVVQKPISKAIESTRDAMLRHEQQYEDPKGAIESLGIFLNEISAALGAQMTYFDFLLKFHEDHQTGKGKAPWLKRIDANLFEVLPSKRRTPPGAEFQEAIATPIHQYRMANAWTMIQDLGLREAA